MSQGVPQSGGNRGYPHTKDVSDHFTTVMMMVMMLVKAQPISLPHPSSGLVGLLRLCVFAWHAMQALLQSTRVRSQQAGAAPPDWPHGRGERGTDTHERDTSPPVGNHSIASGGRLPGSHMINVPFARWSACMVVGEASGWSDWQSYSLDVSSINMLLSVIPSTPTSIPEYQNEELTLQDTSLPLCFIGSSFV